MQAKVTAKLQLSPSDGSMTGGIEVTIEWLPDSDMEDILFRYLLSEGSHDTSTVASADVGKTLLTRVVISSDASLDAAKAKMALYQQYKKDAEMYRGVAVDFSKYIQLKKAEDTALASKYIQLKKAEDTTLASKYIQLKKAEDTTLADS
jgi:hypothetical protein